MVQPRAAKEEIGELAREVREKREMGMSFSS